MKAERQHKECASRVLQPSKGGGGHIVDNRPAEITQRKLINDVSSDINDKNIVQCFKTIQLVIDPELVAKLKEKSIMFTEEYLEFTISAPVGITTEAGVVFLEKGNTKSGYEHLKKHLHDFQDYGIVESNFADLLEATLSKSPDSTEPGNKGGVVAKYFMSLGKGNFMLNIVVASNGYIITAFPGESNANDYYQKLRQDPEIFIRYGGLAGYEAGH